ncbi:DUF2550 domain-containing protein [Salinactinospora qingdaonensis]|uniref:DUF2550 domain-containing protein n=1 Tax=Salinactinospora qingdaonensis TaxID=702744 RepID=A0ABP7FQ80_9ACTN
MGEPRSIQSWLLLAEWLLAAFLALLVLFFLGVAIRRFVLERGGGAVECYLRSGQGDRRPWRVGFARYGSDELRWYRAFSLWPRPTAELSRRGLVVRGRREPTSEELASDLATDLVVIEVGREPDEDDRKEPSYELAMSDATLTGFLSWLESLPPGTSWDS